MHDKIRARWLRRHFDIRKNFYFVTSIRREIKTAKIDIPKILLRNGCITKYGRIDNMDLEITLLPPVCLYFMTQSCRKRLLRILSFLEIFPLLMELRNPILVKHCRWNDSSDWYCPTQLLRTNFSRLSTRPLLLIKIINWNILDNYFFFLQEVVPVLII